MPTLADFIKAYDVRGLVPEQLSPEVARAIGAAFAEVVVIPDGHRGVVVGHDMRPSSPGLSRAFADGVTSRGVDVTLIGLCSTDGLYYASGALDLPGAMFTASHNPAAYNGIKLCRSAARPVGQDSGLGEIRDLAQWLLDSRSGLPDPREPQGVLSERDVLADYAAFLRGLVDISGSRPLTVVVDAGNGMGGHTVPAVLGTGAGLPALPLTVIPLYFELDGTFPNHEANPLDPANLVDLQAAVVAHGADLGLAFDGDADRCFVVDADGQPVSPSAHHRTRGDPRDRPGPGRRGVRRDDRAQRHLQRRRRRDRPRARRHPAPDPRRPLLHQGGDGPVRGRLRRRALGALLLPRLLVRRHRHARRAARPRSPR